MSLILYISLMANPLQDFDAKMYSPAKLSLQEISFDLKMDNLTKRLNEYGALGKLKNVYFKFYWSAPDKKKIMIEGLPHGLNELRDDLSRMVSLNFDFIFPPSFAAIVKDYKMSNKKVDNGELLTFYNPKLEVARIEILLHKDIISEVNLYSPYQVQKNSYVYQENPRLLKKFKSDVFNIATQSSSTTERTITYQQESGYYLPREVVQKEIAGKEQLTTKFTFAKYKINQQYNRN